MSKNMTKCRWKFHFFAKKTNFGLNCQILTKASIRFFFNSIFWNLRKIWKKWRGGPYPIVPETTNFTEPKNLTFTEPNATLNLGLMTWNPTKHALKISSGGLFSLLLVLEYDQQWTSPLFLWLRRRTEFVLRRKVSNLLERKGPQRPTEVSGGDLPWGLISRHRRPSKPPRSWAIGPSTSAPRTTTYRVWTGKIGDSVFFTEFHPSPISPICTYDRPQQCSVFWEKIRMNSIHTGRQSYTNSTR